MVQPAAFAHSTLGSCSLSVLAETAMIAQSVQAATLAMGGYCASGPERRGGFVLRKGFAWGCQDQSSQEDCTGQSGELRLRYVSAEKFLSTYPKVLEWYTLNIAKDVRCCSASGWQSRKSQKALKPVQDESA